MQRLLTSASLGLAFFLISIVIGTTSCSFTNTTESITDSTSSTFNWYHPGLLQKERKIQFFARANFSRLKEDMAAGNGDYLSSLATLMEVPRAHRQDFFDLTKDHFQDLFPSDQTTSKEMLATLSTKLAEAKRGTVPSSTRFRLKASLIPSGRTFSTLHRLLIVLCIGVFLNLQGHPSALASDTEPRSSQYLNELIHRAHQLGLANHRYWHLLLHYRPNVLEGFMSQADDPDFFLAPDGKTDPKAELEATLQAFFSFKEFGDIKQPAQCAFVARYHWLHAQLNFDPNRLPPQPCKEFELWLQELNPEGVSLIFPSAFLNNPPSMFAHTLLRIDQVGQTEETKLLSYTINFAARPTTDFFLAFAYMGLTGGFEGYFGIKPFYELVKKYGDIQNRDIWEYQLNLTPEEILRLLMHEWELQKIHFDYFFFKENCAYQILSLVEVAKPELHLTDQFYLWTIPGETGRLISQQSGLVKRVTFMNSRTTTIRRKVDALEGNEAQILSLIIHDPHGVQDSTFQALSEERQVFLLDLAIDYFQYSTIGKEDEAVEEKAQMHRLLIARSQMHVLPPPLFVSPFTSQPELGHKPARAGFGVGWRQDEVFSGN